MFESGKGQYSKYWIIALSHTPEIVGSSENKVTALSMAERAYRVKGKTPIVIVQVIGSYSP